jgi:hypothetical protein
MDYIASNHRMAWTMTWIRFRRKRLWYNRCITPAFHWKDWIKPWETSVTAGVRTKLLRNVNIEGYHETTLPYHVSVANASSRTATPPIRFIDAVSGIICRFQLLRRFLSPDDDTWRAVTCVGSQAVASVTLALMLVLGAPSQKEEGTIRGKRGHHTSPMPFAC